MPALAAAAFAAAEPRAVLAALRYWDANAATSGAGTTPTGTWGSNSFWTTSSAGTSNTIAWSDNNDAIFSAGSDASSPFTVTVTGLREPLSLAFEEGTVTLNGGTLIQSAGGFIDVNVASGRTATINTTLGLGFSPDKTGTGTLILAGNNTFNGVTRISGGIVKISNDANLGHPDSNVTLNGGTLITTSTISASSGRAFGIGTLGGTLIPMGGTTLTINGQLGALPTGPWAMSGGGTLVLAAGSAASGADVTIDGGGVLHVQSPTALGTSGTALVEIVDGCFEIGGVTVSNPIDLQTALRGTGTAAANGTLTADLVVNLATGSNATDVLTIGNNANDLTGGGATAAMHFGGAGKIILAQSSNYQGVMVLDSGTLEVAADNRLGVATNELSLTGGTFSASDSFATARTINVGPPGGGINVVPGETLTVSTQLLGGGVLTKTGSGTLTLTSASPRTGATSIEGGVLRVNNGTALGPATSLTMSPGTTLHVGGATFNHSGATLGAVGGATITLRSSAGNAGCTGTGALVIPESQPIVLRAVAASDVLTFSRANGPIFSGGMLGSSTITIVGSGKVVLQNDSDYFGDWNLAGGTLQIASEGALGEHPSEGAAPGSRVTIAGGALRVENSSGILDSYRAFTVTAAGGTLAVADDEVFELVGGVGTTTWGAGTLTVTGGGAVTLARQLPAITRVDSGATLVISPGSEVRLAGVVNTLYDGTDRVNVINNSVTPTGLQAYSSQNLGNVDGTGNTHVASGVSFYPTRIRQNQLNIADGGRVAIWPNGAAAGTSKLGTLSMTNAGTFDVIDNGLIVGSGTSKSAIEALVEFGRNSGAWDRSGLTSFAARQQPNHATGLGVLSGAEYTAVGGNGTFSGQSYSATDTLVKYTWNGDTNLNGVINFDDYVRTDVGFNTVLTGWSNGDFNYSGRIDFDDYVLIDIAFNVQSGTLAGAVQFVTGEDRSDESGRDMGVQMVIDHVERFGAVYAQHFLAAVPEPTAATVVLVGAFSFKRKRRA